MKKLINAPSDVVIDMLRGLVALHPGISLLEQPRVLFRADAEAVRDQQVALISGGGSGHEPAHGGYVGAGMLSAAVAGEVFTSPTPNSVFAAIRQVTGNPGALLIVKNYTGDRLNFGSAAEMARSEGMLVESVTVADDVAIAASEIHAGPRGLAGTVFVHKIAGALATEGHSLTAVATVARSVAGDLATMGLSLSAGTVPAVGKPSYVLADDEVEIGLGIHGEPGVRRSALRTSDEFADELVETLIAAAHLSLPERIAVMINNLGATTAMELAIFGGEVVRLLQSRGLTVERVYSGTFMTSLEAAGVSVTLLPVDEERLRCLDAPTSAPAWPNAVERPVGIVDQRIAAMRAPAPAPDSTHDRRTPNPVLRRAIEAACDALMHEESRLTELDRLAGDGDLGINLARGARALKAALPELPLDDLPATLRRIAHVVQEAVGGTSGPLYAIMLLRAGRTLENELDWPGAVSAACGAVEELGGAQPGDRTMLDALLPFATALKNSNLEEAVRAAEEGAEATVKMTPRRGRASYLGQRALGRPDAGAVAVAIWLRAIADALYPPVSPLCQ